MPGGCEGERDSTCTLINYAGKSVVSSRKRGRFFPKINATSFGVIQHHFISYETFSYTFIQVLHTHIIRTHLSYTNTFDVIRHTCLINISLYIIHSPYHTDVIYNMYHSLLIRHHTQHTSYTHHSNRATLLKVDILNEVVFVLMTCVFDLFK